MESSPKISFEDTETAFAYKSDAALKKANFIFSLVNHPWISSLATASVKASLSLRLPVEGLIKKTAFDHFCGGENIEQATRVVDELGKFHVGAILDYSVEGGDDEAGFDATAEETMRTIEQAHRSANIPFCVFKPSGLASAKLLTKIQAGETLTEEEQSAYDRAFNRFDRVCAKGYEY